MVDRRDPIIWPGIFWDILDHREPIPPQLLEAQQALHGYADHRRRRVEDHRRRDQNQAEDQFWAQRAAFRHQADDDPRFPEHNAPSPDDGFLPPISVSVNASITHDTASVTITQEFTNTTGSLIPRAGYTFPLPPGSTVVDFSCRIGRDKLLIGKVKPNTVARKTFDEEVGQNRSAGLLQQNSPELFTTTLGNLPSGTQLKAKLSFIILLDNERGVEAGKARMTFKLPTHIAPRYGTPPQGVDRLVGRSATATSLAVSVDILAATRILSVMCPTFSDADIQVGAATRQQWVDFAARRLTQDARCATVKLPTETSCLDRDFVLKICRADETPGAPFACLEMHPEFPHQSALMLTIPPDALIGTPREYGGGEIVFVADRSGSMSDKIEALKRAMGFFLNGLPPNCSFNIWSFGNAFSSLWPHSLTYNSANRHAAESHVARKFKADLGGTELLNALKRVVSSRGGFATTDIIVLTDGQIWDLDDTINFVKQTKLQSDGRVRFFSLGIGDAVSHELVEGIGKAGGGYAEVIQTASQGGWEGSLVALLKAATQRHVFPKSISIEWGSAVEGIHLQNYSPEEVLQSPHDISKISPFMKNRVLTLLKHSEDVTPQAVKIHYVQPGGQADCLRAPVSVLRVPDSTLHKFAVRALLGDLERGESSMHAVFRQTPRNATEETRQVRLQGEALGCKWSLVSKWTSFVAVEELGLDHEVDGDEAAFVDEEDGPPSGQGRGLNLLRIQGNQPGALRVEALEPMELDGEGSESEESDSGTDTGQEGDERGDGGDDTDRNGGHGHSGASFGPETPGPGNDTGDHGRHTNNGVSESSNQQPEDRSENPSGDMGSGITARRVIREVNILGRTPKPETRHFGARTHLSPCVMASTAAPLVSEYDMLGQFQAHDVLESASQVPMPAVAAYTDEYQSIYSGPSRYVASRARGSATHDEFAFEMSSSRNICRTSVIRSAELITAPHNNLALSSVIQFGEVSNSTDSFANGKRELVRLLLPLQDHVGRFIAINKIAGITMGNILGTGFYQFLAQFMSDGPLQHLASQTLLNSDLGDIARTAAVLQLLRTHFQSCRDLWQLMDSKAIGYLSATCPATLLTYLLAYASEGVAKAHFGNTLSCDECVLNSTIHIPLHDIGKSTDQSVSGPGNLESDPFPRSVINVAGTGVTNKPPTSGRFSSSRWRWFNWRLTGRFTKEAAHQTESAPPGGKPIAPVVLRGSTLKREQGPLSSGEQQDSAGQPASRAADSATELPASSTTDIKTKDAVQAEQEDVAMRLVLGMEVRDGLGSGREVERPDDI